MGEEGVPASPSCPASGAPTQLFQAGPWSRTGAYVAVQGSQPPSVELHHSLGAPRLRQWVCFLSALALWLP